MKQNLNYNVYWF